MADVKSALIETKRALGRVVEPGCVEFSYDHGDGVKALRAPAFKSFSVGNWVWVSYKAMLPATPVVVGVTRITPENTVSVDMKLRAPINIDSLTESIMSTIHYLSSETENALRLSGSTNEIRNWAAEGKVGSTYHLILRQPALASLRFVECLAYGLHQTKCAVGLAIEFDSAAQSYAAEEEPAEDEAAPEVETGQEWVGSHWLQPSVRPLFGAIKAHVEAGQHFNVLLAGASGYGKTTTCRALAEYLGYSFLRIDCSKVTDTEAWFGYQEARDGSTVFEPTAFTKLITEGRAVILLDEANRIEPWIANSLFPILDDDRATEIHNVEIRVAPSVVFVLTVNLGTKYAGTHVIDAAFRNRVDAFDTLVAPPKAVQRKIVAKRYPSLKAPAIREIVDAVEALVGIAEGEGTDVDLTTRTCLKLAKLIGVGLSLRLALEYVVVQGIEAEGRKPFIDAINLKWGTLEGGK